MPKKFLFLMSLKTGAMIMALINLGCGFSFIIGGSIQLTNSGLKELQLYLIICILMGVYNIVTGVTLIYAIIKGDDRTVLIYILMELINLFILTIFSGINIFEYRSIGLIMLFSACLILWYGLYCIYSFYMEIAECNTVKSGAIEITCNTNINPLMQLPEKAIENTPV